MVKKINYTSTILACYLGNFTQAIVINVTPLLFIPLREQFNFSYGQFGFLILLNFFTQVIADIAFSKAVDKYGFRPFVVPAHFLCVLGFVLFAVTPFLFKANEFVGFAISTVIFSCAGGLLELLLSPIIDAIPTDEENMASKSKAMALLHSFYSWGQVVVVIITTLLVFVGLKFNAIVIIWAIIPLINTFLFLKVPMPQKVPPEKVMKIRNLIKNKVFILAFFAILFGGASEVTMSQWSSSFMQQGLGLPKIIGDMLGMCGFAIMMGIGRLFFGLYGHKLNLNNALILGSAGAVLCYIIVALSPFTWLSVLACAMSGICVALLWPGTLVIASQKLPLAGASMFALLAAGGDIGASLAPSLTGVSADFFMKIAPTNISLTAEQFGLRLGILLACLIPMISVIIQIKMKNNRSD